MEEQIPRFAIQTDNLTKWFLQDRHLGGFALPFSTQDGTLAVDQVSMEVKRGEIFGLVGPNGAGKTTLVKILCTLILPTSGAAQVNGYDLSDEGGVKASIGLVTGNERSFYWRLSCRENLRFYAGLHNLSSSQTERKIDELSGLLDLGPFLDKGFDICSTGMKHRLALARGLLNDPTLLFLDEPTKSLDPLAAVRFREAVYTLAHREERTIFLVTHDLHEATELCDRVGVMVRGRLQVVDTPQNLRRLINPQERCRFDIRGFTDQMAGEILGREGVLGLAERGTTGGITFVELHLQDRRRCLSTVVRTIEESGGVIEGLEFEQVSWEEVFQNLTAKEEVRASSQGAAPLFAGERATSMGRLPPHTAGDGEPSLAVASLVHARSEKERISNRGLVGIRRLLYKPLLFLRRDFMTESSYRFAFVLQLLGILFSVASFYFVAQLFGAGAAPYLSAYGGDYFSFVLIGIAFVGYQGVALHTFSRVIRSGQTTGTLEAMLTTPTRLSTILVSSGLWNFAFTSLRVIVYLIVGMAVFGVAFRQANVLAALVILMLTILALSGIGILSACFIMIFKRGDPVNFLFGSLSTLLAGVYYPVEVLPSWLQTVAYLFPLTYSLQAVRRALLMGDSLVALVREVVVLTLFSAVLLPLSLLAFRYAVRQAKRDGSLAQF